MPKTKYTEKESKVLKKLGDNVRKYREELDITQSELAWNVEVDRTYISDIERGTRNISLLVMVRLAKSLKVEIADLVN